MCQGCSLTISIDYIDTRSHTLCKSSSFTSHYIHLLVIPLTLIPSTRDPSDLAVSLQYSVFHPDQQACPEFCACNSLLVTGVFPPAQVPSAFPSATSGCLCGLPRNSHYTLVPAIFGHGMHQKIRGHKTQCCCLSISYPDRLGIGSCYISLPTALALTGSILHYRVPQVPESMAVTLPGLGVCCHPLLDVSILH